MTEYKISIEAAEEYEILKKNFSNIIISLIKACASEVDKNEESDNLSASIN